MHIKAHFSPLHNGHDHALTNQCSYPIVLLVVYVIYNILFTGIGDRSYVGKLADMMIPRSYHNLQQKILADIGILKSLNDKNPPIVLWNKIKRYLNC